MLVVADKVAVLVNTMILSKDERLVLLEAISDLRAGYCSTCNKSIRMVDGRLDADVVGMDEFKNKRYECHYCISQQKGKN